MKFRFYSIFDFIISVYKPIYLKLLGTWIIYIVLKYHFNWDFSTIESCLMGFGMGLIIA